ncbi:MAG: 2'-5' RNA ligase family protein, partial [Spirochaetales bacterium]
ITELLKTVANHFQPYICEVSGMGAFPNPWEPRVVWAGIDIGSTESTEISEHLRQALKKAKVSFDTKPFRPHITLAYARKHLNRYELREAGSIFIQILSQYKVSLPRSSLELPVSLAGADLKSPIPPISSRNEHSTTLTSRVSFQMTEIALVKSELKAQGAEHTPLEHIPLGKKV